MMHIIILLLIGQLLNFSFGQDGCQKLAICALEKCIAMKDYHIQDKSKLLSDILFHANFACIFGPSCYDQCAQCDACKYAQDQIRKIVMNKPTDGKCPELENCAETCIAEEFRDPFSCVFRRRCSRHCLDEWRCAPCHNVVKRVFTGFCHRRGLTEKFGQKCRPMFDELVANYTKRH